MVMIVGILSFTIVAAWLSWAVGQRAQSADRGETSVSVLLVSWGALLYGIFIGR